MNARRRTLAVLLFGVLFSIGIGGQLVSKANGIEMTVAYGFIASGVSEPGSFLDANVYLKNCSTESLNVVVGPILGPRYGTGLVSYSVVLSPDNQNTTIKPSPGSLDIIELKPGEMAKLKHFRCSTEKAYNQRILVRYDIDKELMKFYPNVWAHELSISIEIK